MEEEDYCHILRLRAVPHILRPDESNFLIPLENVSRNVQKEGFPSLLASQLEKAKQILENADKIDYYTLTYQGNTFLDTNTQFVEIELLPQPYVLYNVDENKSEHKATIQYAVYTLDSLLSKSSFTEVSGNLKIDPDDIFKSNVDLCINVSQKKLHSSSRIRISTALPVQVFYTLMYVHYDRKVVKVLVSRNIFIFNDSNQIGNLIFRIAHCENYEEKVDYIGQVWACLANVNRRSSSIFDKTCFETLANELGRPLAECIDSWRNRMFYFIYVKSGCPQGQLNFGADEYQKRVQKSSMEPPLKWVFNWSTEFLNRCFQSVLDEIFDLVKQL